jgi:hypothetical protein
MDAESHSLPWFTPLLAATLQRVCGAIAKILDIGHAEKAQIFRKRTVHLFDINESQKKP